MCEQSKTALEMLKASSSKRITNKELFMVLDKIISDTSKISDRVNSLEKKVDDGFAHLTTQIDTLTKLMEEHNKPKLLDKLFGIKYFWFWVILVTLIVGGLLGVKPDLFHSIITLGG